MQEHIPELAAAIEQEKTRREIAFSGTLIPVAGVWLNQFTPLHWVNLGLIRSPFLGGDRGSMFSAVAILEFLWICSPDYRPGSYWRQLWFFIRHYRAINPMTAAAIFAYIDAAFMDSPPTPAGQVAGDRRSYYAGVTSLCDFFGTEYGWDDAATMAKPMARLFQYFNHARRRNDPHAIMFNPSDRLIGKLHHERTAANG